MKHIKKKFLFELEESKLPSNLISVDINNIENAAIPKDKTLILGYSSGKYVTAFQFNVNGKKIVIPEPDPILIYFNNAYIDYRRMLDDRKKLLDILHLPFNEITEDVVQQLYNFFGISMNFAINLFTSIEAFINKSCLVE